MRYFIGFLITVGLIFFVFVLILRGFQTKPAEVTKSALTDYATTSAQVSMTVDGRVVSEQEHQAYRITVDRSEARIEALSGYENQVVDTRTFTNNQASYYVFLRALDLAGFTKGAKLASDQANDERGVCANGRRYIFELTNGTSTIQRYWSATCTSRGTFKGNSSAVKQLFDRQIPTTDFSQVTGRLVL